MGISYPNGLLNILEMKFVKFVKQRSASVKDFNSYYVSYIKHKGNAEMKPQPHQLHLSVVDPIEDSQCYYQVKIYNNHHLKGKHCNVQCEWCSNKIRVNLDFEVSFSNYSAASSNSVTTIFLCSISRKRVSRFFTLSSEKKILNIVLSWNMFQTKMNWFDL